jgi:hypothetical protein
VRSEDTMFVGQESPSLVEKGPSKKFVACELK